MTTFAAGWLECTPSTHSGLRERETCPDIFPDRWDVASGPGVVHPPVFPCQPLRGIGRLAVTTGSSPAILGAMTKTPGALVRYSLCTRRRARAARKLWMLPHTDVLSQTRDWFFELS